VCAGTSCTREAGIKRMMARIFRIRWHHRNDTRFGLLQPAVLGGQDVYKAIELRLYASG